MNMPGFTAEASLYTAVGHYSAQYLNTTGKGESFDSTRVLPQVILIRLFVQLPDIQPGPYGGGGGGGYPSQDMSAGQNCRRVYYTCGISPTGRMILCYDRICDLAPDQPDYVDYDF